MVEIGAVSSAPGAAATRKASHSREAAGAAPATTIDEERSSARPASLLRSRVGPFLQVAASLLWIPQAGLIALAVGNIATGNPVDQIFWQAGGVLALGASRSLLDAVGGRIAFRQARALLSIHRRNAITSLASRSPIDIDRPASGRAASTLAEQAEAIVPYLARFQPARFRATIIPAAILICVLIWSWAAALVLLIAAPLIPIFMMLIGWRAKAASEAQLVELGSMNAFLLDRLRCLTTIRALDAVDETARRLRSDAESLRARTMTVLKIAFLSSAVLELFSALGVAMAAVYIGFHLLGQLPFGAWGDKLSLAEGLFILLLTPAFFEPLRDLSAVWHDRAAGEAALEALRHLDRKGTALPEAENGDAISAPIRHFAPPVRVENLHFRHAPKSEPVFDGFNLDVATGEHIALLGPSGCGKSTLLALLAGLALPESGNILIDSEKMSAATAARLRRRIAWIGQHPHIFAGTIAGNVALGQSGVDTMSIRDALRLVGLEEMAGRRGAASIGENGVGLSGGEASRLALARIALATERGLILADEPTAHLDRSTAKSIADALIALAHGRTLIVATHDPLLAARMGRVVRLGPVVQEDAA